MSNSHYGGGCRVHNDPDTPVLEKDRRALGMQERTIVSYIGPPKILIAE